MFSILFGANKQANYQESATTNSLQNFAYQKASKNVEETENQPQLYCQEYIAEGNHE